MAYGKSIKTITFNLQIDKYNQLKKLGFGKFSNYRIANMGIDCLINSHMNDNKPSLKNYPVWFLNDHIDKVILFDYLFDLSKKDIASKERKKIINYIYHHFKETRNFMNEMTDPQSIFYIKAVKDTLGKQFEYENTLEERKKTIDSLIEKQDSINSNILEKGEKIKAAEKRLEELNKEIKIKEKALEEVNSELEMQDEKTFRIFKKRTIRLIDLIYEMQYDIKNDVYFTDVAKRDMMVDDAKNIVKKFEKTGGEVTREG